MRIISFAETTPALLAGHKTCTRRPWKEDYAALFHQGDLVQAYDKSPRVGGKRVATIQLTTTPMLCLTLPPDDWVQEGFQYMETHGLTLFHGMTPRQVWESWSEPGGQDGLWVVRFKLKMSLATRGFLCREAEMRGSV